MGSQELWDIALGKVRIMLAAENTRASSEHALTNLVHPTDAGVGILDPLVFQLGFSRLLPYHLRWNPIFSCVPPHPSHSSIPTTPSTGNPKCYQSASRGGQVDFPQFPRVLGQGACFFAD